MPHRPQADVMSDIDSLLDDFDGICRHAFTTYRGYPPEVLVEHDPRAAAACTYAHMAADAERRFAEHPIIKLVDPRPLGGLKVWRIGDLAVVDLKSTMKTETTGTIQRSRRRISTEGLTSLGCRLPQ